MCLASHMNTAGSVDTKIYQRNESLHSINALYGAPSTTVFIAFLFLILAFFAQNATLFPKKVRRPIKSTMFKNARFMRVCRLIHIFLYLQFRSTDFFQTRFLVILIRLICFFCFYHMNHFLNLISNNCVICSTYSIYCNFLIQFFL